MTGLFARLIGRGRPDAETVAAQVAAAIARVPGVVDEQVGYNHLQYSAGALSGVVDLDAAVTFDDVLRAAHAALVEQLGDDADRVVVYLSGRTADGHAVEPDAFGLPQRPTGTDLRRRYA
ncbi:MULTISPECIES: hypothetical protein [unclassified Nocardioides]|uniref:hypothetical protein n=1 Tax=unclassified Nocardioides TaxID=2615069 RepID=UPI000A272697|nr:MULTISPECIES: hypothetical protein [unclassified Nocardioides]